MQSLSSLQVARVIAATSVVYYHIVYLRVSDKPVFGSFGVDVFFVLSGFVMAMVVARGQSAYEFGVSRVVRILPLYWVLTTCLLALVTLKPTLLNSTTADLGQYLKSLLFIPFFRDNGAMLPLLALGWSLNYEMLFYFCLFIGLAAGRGRPLVTGTALLLGSYLVLGQLSGDHLLESFFGSSLIFEFLLGIVAFHIYKTGVVQKVPRKLLVACGLVTYGLMIAAEASGIGVAFRLYLFGIPAVLLVLALACLEESFAKSPWITRTLTTMGDASYATYLVHVYVIEALRRVIFPRLGVQDVYSLPKIALIVALALIAGQLLFLWVDRPMHRYFKRRFLMENRREVIPSQGA